MAKVTKIERMRVIEIPDEVCVQEGSVNSFALMVRMKMFHPEVTLDSEVTVVHFTVANTTINSM